jgi:cytochrome c
MRTCVLAGLLVFAWSGAALAQDAAAGQQTFQRFCLPCHDAGEGARVKLGPPLNGLDGKKAGTTEGFNYSDAMKGSGITWGDASFKEYIAGPMQKVPGTRMAFTGLREEKDRNDIWAFLGSIKADGSKK